MNIYEHHAGTEKVDSFIDRSLERERERDRPKP